MTLSMIIQAIKILLCQLDLLTFSLFPIKYFIFQDTIPLAKACYLAEKVFRERILGVDIKEKDRKERISEIYFSSFVTKNKSLIIGNREEKINIEIYDINGRLLKIINQKPPIYLDKRTKRGIYFIRMPKENSRELKKIINLY